MDAISRSQFDEGFEAGCKDECSIPPIDVDCDAWRAGYEKGRICAEQLKKDWQTGYYAGYSQFSQEPPMKVDKEEWWNGYDQGKADAKKED